MDCEWGDDFLRLHDGADDESKKMFNIFCENAEYIADYLVAEIHKIDHNKSIRYLTLNRIFILLFMNTFRKNRFFYSVGNRKF